jgi:hypothetical protein
VANTLAEQIAEDNDAFLSSTDFFADATVTYTTAEGVGPTTVTAHWILQIGALDDTDRMVVRGVVGGTLANVQRNDYFVVPGDSRRWNVVDVKAESGIFRALCLAPIERT